LKPERTPAMNLNQHGARGHQVALKDHMSCPSVCSEIAQIAVLPSKMHLIVWLLFCLNHT